MPLCCVWASPWGMTRTLLLPVLLWRFSHIREFVKATCTYVQKFIIFNLKSTLSSVSLFHVGLCLPSVKITISLALKIVLAHLSKQLGPNGNIFCVLLKYISSQRFYCVLYIVALQLFPPFPIYLLLESHWNHTHMYIKTCTTIWAYSFAPGMFKLQVWELRCW